MRISVVLAAVAFGLYAQPEYSVQTVAGSDWVGDGGPARQALLLQAEGLAVDRTGNVYIADAAGNSVRRVDAQGIIHTVTRDVAAPYGLAIDPQGRLHIADLGNARVVRLERDGTLTVIVSGPLAAPRNLTFDRAGNLYISDFAAHTVYRRMVSGGLSVVAGPPVLSFPAGLAVDAAGAVYIADSQHHRVVKAEGASITTFAEVAAPVGLAFDAAGVLHVADAFTGRVLRFGIDGPLSPLNLPAREIAFGADGAVYTASGEFVRRIALGVNAIFAGGGDRAHGDHGPAIEARLNAPTGVALDEAGNLYIADRDNHRVRRVSPDGIIDTLAGGGIPGSSGDNGLATRAFLNSPTDVAVDRAGNVFIADHGNRRVRVVSPGGLIQTIATGLAPENIAVTDTGTVLVSGEAFVYRIEPGGALIPVATSSETPGVTADLAGRALGHAGVIYVADPIAHRVYAYIPQPEPVIEISVVHAATLQPAAVAPGMLLLVRGVPEGAEILANGNVVPELARTGDDVVVQAPAVLAGLTLEVRKPGSASAIVTLPAVLASPGLFAATTADGSPPERGGILVLYGTGEGLSGAAPSITIGGYAAEVLYSGAVAAYPGLWQINVRAPAGYLPPGDHAIIADVAGFASPPFAIALK